jgi:adenylate kinase
MLDGFPRTRPQAEALDVSADPLGRGPRRGGADRGRRRADPRARHGRRSDPETGNIYHLKFNPPPPEAEGRLVHRADDTEAACTARLEKYHRETTPIVPFYESKGLLKRVDGVGSPDEVLLRITAALQTVQAAR